ncbi:hypothetical protein NEOLI_001480 [Neolecta irregularis DAH-3]|uniref:Neuroguidin n=1 Tax=Neolecta irregularis (strain DAH-3) TaxID=1198029 RepID=A0A1U7LUW0_NEOID|nr:hypothetical protein NEOLI_001480 [Neolecta irregularis DAH-3]|eukprot:OLL26301.1 hypothetical protein NEOLI_001480 [Neolecta irregularis DAH-3]
MDDQFLQTISDSLSSISTSLPVPEDTRNGISLLILKNDLHLSYLQNLVFLILLRLRGEEIQDHPVVWQLIENRVWIERGINPLETKLRYSIEKLLKAAEKRDIVNETPDALLYKPNPSALVSQVADSAETETVYRPPKISSMAPPTSAPRPRKNRLVSDFIDAELSHAPIEEPSIGSHRSRMSTKERRDQDNRKRYEEDNFIRLPEEKKKKRRAQGLDDFDVDIGGPYNFEQQPSLAEKSRKTNEGSKTATRIGAAFNKRRKTLDNRKKRKNK